MRVSRFFPCWPSCRVAKHHSTQISKMPSSILDLSVTASYTTGNEQFSTNTGTASSTIGPFVVAHDVYSGMKGSHIGSTTSNDDSSTTAGSVGPGAVDWRKAADEWGADDPYQLMRAMREKRGTTTPFVTVTETPQTPTQGQKTGEPRTNEQGQNVEAHQPKQQKDEL